MVLNKRVNCYKILKAMSIFMEMTFSRSWKGRRFTWETIGFDLHRIPGLMLTFIPFRLLWNRPVSASLKLKCPAQCPAKIWRGLLRS